MPRLRYAFPWQGSLLLLVALPAAEAQYPRPAGNPTSSAGTLFPDSAVTTPKTGSARQLVCRGAAGLQVTTQQDPSPRSPQQVRVSLAYRRNPGAAGMAYEQVEPGACSWNPLGDATAPAEPGIVHFDLERTGSEHIPDPARLTIWLSDPRHYWVFYVDDLTNLSGSHGAYGGNFRVADTLVQAPRKSTTSAQRRERLRCRGGGGATFARGERKGPNLFAMTLSYQVASTAAGPIGKGLDPGTCAWADRTDAPAEPGRIEFITARNAQREQEQSGGPVDSSATAAERWPDVRTIPAYMTDPARFWTFTVSLTNPDSALRHQAWTPTASGAPDPPPAGPVATTPPVDDRYTSDSPRGTSTRVSLPGGSTEGDRYDPGASTSTNPTQVFDIRHVQVTSGLDGVSIRFEAAPGLTPVVSVSTTAPEGAAGSQRFGGQAARLVVQGTPTGGTHWRYSAASNTPLARGTRYWFIAEAPEGPNSRYNQATGEFRTLAQRVTLIISDIQIVSDGDAESAGDLWFGIASCPENVFDQRDIVGGYKEPVQWTEGRHAVNLELTSRGPSVGDRLRVMIVGTDDDEDAGSGGSSNPFWSFSCEVAGAKIEPYKSGRAEWNAVIMDLDLTQYPGAKATEQFIRRSQPIRDGVQLMFEVRGYVTVTRE